MVKKSETQELPDSTSTEIYDVTSGKCSFLHKMARTGNYIAIKILFEAAFSSDLIDSFFSEQWL